MCSVARLTEPRVNSALVKLGYGVCLGNDMIEMHKAGGW